MKKTKEYILETMGESLTKTENTSYDLPRTSFSFMADVNFLIEAVYSGLPKNNIKYFNEVIEGLTFTIYEFDKKYNFEHRVVDQVITNINTWNYIVSIDSTYDIFSDMYKNAASMIEICLANSVDDFEVSRFISLSCDVLTQVDHLLNNN